MNLGDIVLFIAGLTVFLWRTRPWIQAHCERSQDVSDRLVSIIVPCRNEENNVLPLIESLRSLTGVRTELIIVDDQSEDRTLALAQQNQVQVVQAPEKPEGWVGKSWACFHGAQVARGDFLLFTDADTRHRPKSLKAALSYLVHEEAGLLSAPPYHRCLNWWERGLGLFHLLPLIAARFPCADKSDRLYAIGQYLLFSRDAYLAAGGHKAVSSSLTEDIDLAKNILHVDRRYVIYPEANLYEVQMYDNAAEFWYGWKRLLRLGMRKVTPLAFAEVTLMFCLYFHFSVLILASVITLALVQRKHGAFSFWGALLAPLSLVLFASLSFAGVLDTFKKKRIIWQGRDYVES